MLITKKHRFLYGLGYLGVLLPGVVFNAFASYFYIQHVKLNPAWIGIAFGVVSVWEALISPFIGYLSDRTKTPMGRRKPYIVFGIPIRLLFFWLLFTPMFDSTQPVAAMIWFIVTMFAVDSVMMILDINWLAVNPEMNTDLAARSQQGAIIGVMSMIGIVLVSSVTPLLAGEFGWSTTAIIIGVFALAISGVGLLGLKENPKLAKNEPIKLKESVKLTLGFRPSRFYIGLSVVFKVAMTAITSMIPLFSIWVLGVSEAESGILLMATTGGMVLCFPFFGSLINKIGPAKGFLFGLISIIAVSVVVLFVPPVNFAVEIVLFALFSVGLSLLLLSQMILLSDLIDADALKVGQRREGMYTSVSSLVDRVGVFIFSVTMGIVLNAFGFDANLNAQSPDTLIAIKAILAGLPLLMGILGLFILKGYPITDEKAKEIRNQAKIQREELEQREEFAS